MQSLVGSDDLINIRKNLQPNKCQYMDFILLINPLNPDQNPTTPKRVFENERVNVLTYKEE